MLVGLFVFDLAVCPGIYAQTATFSEVLPLNGVSDDILSLHDMTADGSVIVGANKSAAAGNVTSVIWERPAPLDCNRDADGVCTTLFIDHISGDGAYFTGLNSTGALGFRWTPSGGPEFLVPPGPDNPFDYVVPNFISHDGSVVVGATFQGGLVRAFRWTQATGLTDLGGAPGEGTVPHGASADGSVIVGYRDAGTGRRAFRWTATDGMTTLDLGADFFSEAAAISADGKVIAGFGDIPGQSGSGFVWTADDGAESIPFPLELSGTQQPMAVSNEGVVYGTLFIANAGGQVVFVWDELHGTRLLRDELLAQGAQDASGWILESITAASDDCQTLVGDGHAFQSGPSRTWLATLAAPSHRGDVNCDGRIDGADVGAFVTAILSPADYLAMHPECEIQTADTNADSVVDSFDIESFLSLVLDAD